MNIGGAAVLRLMEAVGSVLGAGVWVVWACTQGVALASEPAATPAELLAKYTAQAAQPAQPVRGQAFFTTAHGKEWSCASCHGTTPTLEAKHASTAKPIAPLAPAFNPKRFTDAVKTEKWFRRNCNDVLARECSATEKADVLAWLMTLKP
jgi:hypothetical protein